MAQDTTPALILYVGDGSQTRFEVPFDKGAYGEIKVAFVRRGLTDYTYNPDTYTVDGYLYAWNGGVYTKTEAVDTDTPLYDKNGEATGDTWTAEMYREPKNDIFTQAVVEWTGDALTTNDVICIVRDTVKDQPYSYPNNQKHIERALDNLARQIQELQLTADNALKVDPSWNYTMNDPNKMDPITWLQTIVRSKDQTLREVKIDNNYIMYSTDDPDAEAKTWNVLAGVKTGNAGVVSHIRETKVLAEDGVTYIPFLEYSVDGGDTWTPAGQAASALEHQYVRKTGDTLSGMYKHEYGSRVRFMAANSTTNYADVFMNSQEFEILFHTSNSVHDGLYGRATNGYVTLYPGTDNQAWLGLGTRRWERVWTTKLCPDTTHVLTLPAQTGTLATTGDISAAVAAGGVMITAQGFWYAKMDSGTTPPSAEDGTNYADFSQVDGDNNPIIVTYNRVSGAWVQDQTITPPADSDGYVLITSKIWDIPEQTGQQGGKVFWNHVSKEFTPHPTIISLENQTLTSCNLVTCTATLPSTVTTTSVVNAGYVVDRQNWQDISDETFVATAMEIDLADDKTMYFVDATADTEITIDSSAVSITAGSAKTFEIHVVCGATVPTITWQGIDAWLVDSETSPVEANKTSIFAIRVQQRPSDLTPTVVANYGGAY